MDLHLTADEVLSMKPAVSEDVRRRRASVQGAQILSVSLGLDEATKACLWTMVREWEVKHEPLCSVPFVPANISNISKEAMLYLKGLEYQMSGNELWSRTTPRYLVVD
ncbi:hypothetical protein MY3296_003856 [Beauveria thailandica]